MPGWLELLLVAFVGLLLFGKRLPEVARSIGQSVVEFKQGLQGFKHDVDNAGKPAAGSTRTPSNALADPPKSNPAPSNHPTGE
jgi:sec-independent protein translocase protein TatA